MQPTEFDITGINKAVLLAELFNNLTPNPKTNFFQPNPKLSIEDAQLEINKNPSLEFNTLLGLRFEAKLADNRLILTNYTGTRPINDLIQTLKTRANQPSINPGEYFMNNTSFVK